MANNDGTVRLATDNSVLVLSFCNFTHSAVGHDGGAVFVYDNTNLMIDSCRFKQNYVGGSGGSIYGRGKTTISIHNGTFQSSSADNSGGAVHKQNNCIIKINNSSFTDNQAAYGGVIRVYSNSVAIIVDSFMQGNRAVLDVGVLDAYQDSHINIQNTDFEFNNASYGGALAGHQSILTINQSSFSNNSAQQVGGVMRFLAHNSVTVVDSYFRFNTAENGGVLYADGSDINIQSSDFIDNEAFISGGVLYVTNGGNVDVDSNCSFTGNHVESHGGVMSLSHGTTAAIHSCMFDANRAAGRRGVVDLQRSNLTVSGSSFDSSTARTYGGVVNANGSTIVVISSSFTYNSAMQRQGGALNLWMNSNATIESSNFSNNSARLSGGGISMEEKCTITLYNSNLNLNSAINEKGGAIFAIGQSNVIIAGCSLYHNTAHMHGAALAAKDTSLIISQIENNVANNSGGGIYISQSTVNFGSTAKLYSNQALENGGAIFAVDSSVVFSGSNVSIDSNQALNGGGIYLKRSKLHGENLKSNVSLTSNKASDGGGALYVKDVCNDSMQFYCFFGNLNEDLISIDFNNNRANRSGSDLYGGLLSEFTIYGTDSSRIDLSKGGIDQFMSISNIKDSDHAISSEPTQLCRCIDDTHMNCDQKHNFYETIIEEGKEFNVSIVAINQVGKPVQATLYSSVKGTYTLPADQTIQSIPATCYNHSYRVLSSSNTSKRQFELNLYVQEDPCSGTDFSLLSINVSTKECSCDPGFMKTNDSTRCICNCDERLMRYKQYGIECDSGTKSLTRRGLSWIEYIDNEGYLFAPYCPFGYCKPSTPEIPINFNPADGDEQCSKYRTGTLCGKCLPGYGLSLGSSKCMKCRGNKYGVPIGIILVALVAGVMLVFTILALNLTVAVGTLNSIILYANIMYVHRAVYFRDDPAYKALAIIVSWFNLDIGIDTCFYNTMDTYQKTWLQLLFPAYIITLVVVIIIVSSYSSKFSNIIGKSDPVATLVTLLLLSYTRFLITVIKSFQYAPMKYPDNTTKTVWLPDANLTFGESTSDKVKLVVLSSFSSVILLLCVLWTMLLFLWQWLLRCPNRIQTLLCLTRNLKFHSFVDTYHTPIIAKHRYWIGLLLLARVTIVVISGAFARSELPVTLFTTVLVMCCLLLYRSLLMIKVYKNRFLNIMESVTFFNIAAFALITIFSYNITVYTSSNGKSEEDIVNTVQKVAAYLSVLTTLTFLVIVIVYHCYIYCGCAKAKVRLGQNIKKTRPDNQLVHEENEIILERSETSLFLDALDNPRANFGAPFVPFKNDK